MNTATLTKETFAYAPFAGASEYLTLDELVSTLARSGWLEISDTEDRDEWDATMLTELEKAAAFWQYLSETDECERLIEWYEAYAVHVGWVAEDEEDEEEMLGIYSIAFHFDHTGEPRVVFASNYGSIYGECFNLYEMVAP